MLFCVCVCTVWVHQTPLAVRSCTPRKMSKVLQIPITETANELTTSIDVVDHVGFVRLLRQSDMQLFSGYADVPSVYDPR